MALYEYRCRRCELDFEQYSNLAEDSGPPKCAQCHQSDQIEKLLSRFRVGGRGDLRESTLHGCHEHDVSGSEHHSHDSSDSEDS